MIEDREYGTVILEVNQKVVVGCEFLYLAGNEENYPIVKKVNLYATVTKYTYCEPVGGTAHGVFIPSLYFPRRLFIKVVADAHTHGDWSVGKDIDIDDYKFSPRDMETNILSYLVTPLGVIKAYDPHTQQERVLTGYIQRRQIQ